MERDILPYFHVNFLDIDVFQTVVDQVNVVFKITSVVENQTYYLHQDLVAELFDDSDLDLWTLYSEGLQFVLPALCLQKLLLLSNNCNELQKYLHHRQVLRNQRDRQPGANLSDSHVRSHIKQPVDGLSQKNCLSLQLV